MKASNSAKEVYTEICEIINPRRGLLPDKIVEEEIVGRPKRPNIVEKTEPPAFRGDIQ